MGCVKDKTREWEKAMRGNLKDTKGRSLDTFSHANRKERKQILIHGKSKE